MVGWHHQHDGHESEQAQGIGDGQKSLACYSPWARRELDMTELITLLLSFTESRSYPGERMFLPFHIVKTLLTKVHLVKAMVSIVVMYGCESWTIKKAGS